MSENTIKNHKSAIFSAYRLLCNSNIETINLSNLLKKYLSKYDNVIIMGNFNIDVKDKTNPNFDKFSEFCDTFSLSNLIKDYTCFAKTLKSSIDLILTKKEHSFQLTKTTETGVSDVHLLISTFMRTQTICLPPKKVMYRDFKNLNEKAFLENVKLKNLSRKNDDSNENYELFSYQFQSLVNKHAPLKTKIVLGNNAPFVNKTLRKETSKRNALRNKFLKDSSDSNW